MPDTIQLHNLSVEMRMFLAYIEELDGELPGEALHEFNELDLSFTNKIIQTALAIREIEETEGAIRGEVKRLLARAQRHDRIVKWLRAQLMEAMKLAEVDSIKNELVSVRVQQNPKVVFSWAGEDEESIPEEYRKVLVKYALDDELVRQAHEAGVPLPEGIRASRGSHLRIS